MIIILGFWYIIGCIIRGDGLIKGFLIKICFWKVIISFGYNMYDNFKFDKYFLVEIFDFFMVNILEDINWI